MRNTTTRGFIPLIIIAVIALVAAGIGTKVYLNSRAIHDTTATSSPSVDTGTQVQSEVADTTSSTSVKTSTSVTPAPKATPAKTDASKTASPTPVPPSKPAPVPTSKPAASPVSKPAATTEAAILGWWYIEKPTTVNKCPTLDCATIGTTDPNFIWNAVARDASLFSFTSDGKPGYIVRSKATFIGDNLQACSIPLSYGLGTIGGDFPDHNFTHSELELLTQKAEAMWETALGKNLFNYKASGASNLINFGGQTGTAEDPGAAGVARPRMVSDVVARSFDISINDNALLAPNDLSYDERERYRRDIVVETIAHELGHVLGVQHVNLDGHDIMSANTQGDAAILELTPTDIAAGKATCSKVADE